MVEVEASPKPIAMVIEPNVLPGQEKEIFTIIQKSVSAALPVYDSFASAVNAINIVLLYKENHPGKIIK
jgi:hypothetical protein